MAHEWYVTRAGQERGPYSGTKLKELVVKGDVKPDDLVRREDMPAPRPASSIKGLFHATAASTEASSPDQPANAPQQKTTTKKKWIVIGSVVAAVLLLS